jgi:hypothetical protein
VGEIGKRIFDGVGYVSRSGSSDGTCFVLGKLLEDRHGHVYCRCGCGEEIESEECTGACGVREEIISLVYARTLC